MYAKLMLWFWIAALALSLPLPLSLGERGWNEGPALQAQVKSDDPPAVGRPPNFSQVVGTYRISKFTAEPTEVAVEDPITVTVHITGKGNKKYQPQRRFLRLFKEEVERDFYIEPVPDQDRVFPGKNEEQTWQFVYRLRPKSTRAREVPEPRLVYFVPFVGYRTSDPPNEDPIRLTVKRRSEPKASDYSMRFLLAPDRLYQQTTGDAVLAQDEPIPYWNLQVLIALGLGIPILSWLSVLFWQWLYPDSLRQLQRRRSLAARRAVRDLNHAKKAYTASSLAKILTIYLSQRLDFPAVEPTPVEVTRFLRRRGVAVAVRQQWADLFSTFDEDRYTPPRIVNGTLSPSNDSWPTRAVHLIHALEADPCLAYPR